MSKNKKLKITQYIGAIGTVIYLGLYIAHPSFPTPDKIIVFFILVFMIFAQALQMLKMMLPFVAILLIYDSFRGIADQLNSNINYTLSPHMDKLIFGQLPTVYLQNHWWKGHASWYDYVLYFPYFLHFILPLFLAIIVWKKRASEYWKYVTTFLVVSFAAFFTFWLMPSAPPWLASQNGQIEHITRISSELWSNMGIKDFPSVYNKISPNTVAAIPSLHAAWAILLLLFVTKFFGRRWGLVAAIYPILIFVGTIYTGEHYAFDLMAGSLYALAAFYLTPIFFDYLAGVFHQKRRPLQPKAKRLTRPSRA